jgi:hypothetical protein
MDEAFGLLETGIYTSRNMIKKAAGQVYLIVGVGRPKRYYLWSTFRIRELDQRENTDGSPIYTAFGSGWGLSPPQELKGGRFEAFKRECANFVGFRRIDDLPYTKTLVALAAKFRRRANLAMQCDFIEQVMETLRPRDNERKRLKGMLRRIRGEGASEASDSEPRLALSIAQPWAEAILRGKKKAEYRSFQTHVRGKVYLYASQTRWGHDVELTGLRDYGIRSVDPDSLDRGFVVGTMDIVGCEKAPGKRGVFAWKVENVHRFKKPIRPNGQPQPVWFRPF